MERLQSQFLALGLADVRAVLLDSVPEQLRDERFGCACRVGLNDVALWISPYEPQTVGLELSLAGESNTVLPFLPLTVRSPWYSPDKEWSSEERRCRDEYLRKQATKVAKYGAGIIRPLNKSRAFIEQKAHYWNQNFPDLDELLLSDDEVIDKVLTTTIDANEYLFSWRIIESAAGFLEDYYSSLENHSRRQESPDAAELATLSAQVVPLYRRVREIATSSCSTLRGLLHSLPRFTIPFEDQQGMVEFSTSLGEQDISRFVTPPSVAHREYK